MLQATILATSSGRDWRTWLYTRWPHAGRVYIRCRSNVTPRLFIVTDGWMTASETCSDLATSTNCRPLSAVNRIASDLLGFSCRPLLLLTYGGGTLFECVDVHLEVVLRGCNVHLHGCRLRIDDAARKKSRSQMTEEQRIS